MRALRRLACVPFVVLAVLLVIVDIPIGWLAMLAVRTVGIIIDVPALTEYFERIFLLRAVRCPRCGRSDITTIADVD